MPNVSMSMSDAELLKFAIENGMLDTALVRDKIEMQKREELLGKHKYDIWQGTNGKWYTYLPDEEKGRKLLKKATREAIEDAVIKYWQIASDDPTVKEIFYMWIREKLEYEEIAKNTYDRYETDFIRFFSNDFGKMRIKKVTREDLEIFIKTTIRDKQLTAKAYAGLRTLLLGIFKYAKKCQYTDLSISLFFSDLSLSKKIFKRNIRCDEKEVFTEAEIEKLIFQIKWNESIRTLGVLLAIQTGLRPGELSALKPIDIHLKERCIHVQRSEIKYKDTEGKNVIEVRDYPKSDAGDRYLILTDDALLTAKKLLQINAFGEYLFQDEHTHLRISENGFNHKLSRLCAAANIPVRTMHKLRKTYGTRLIDADVDDSVIKDQMGHADIKTTRQYYYYSNKGAEEKLKQLNKACIG
ncbi:MAG: site-specific integrase [Acetatifactor sp.]|nr:site-specific integrase [Acetatifactor sp.]